MYEYLYTTMKDFVVIFILFKELTFAGLQQIKLRKIF